VAEEVVHHLGDVVAYGDADVFFKDDTQRDCGIWRSRHPLGGVHVRDAEDNHSPSVFSLYTRTFVHVGNIRQEIVGHLQFVNQVVGIFL